VGSVDLSHASRTQPRENFEGAELPTDQALFALGRHSSGQDTALEALPAIDRRISGCTAGDEAKECIEKLERRPASTVKISLKT
jgi:hypothetical protein